MEKLTEQVNVRLSEEDVITINQFALKLMNKSIKEHGVLGLLINILDE